MLSLAYVKRGLVHWHPCGYELAGVRSALAVANTLTSARHNTASQTVLIIFCPRIASRMENQHKIQAVKGRNKLDNMEGRERRSTDDSTYIQSQLYTRLRLLRGRAFSFGPIRLRN